MTLKRSGRLIEGVADTLVPTETQCDRYPSIWSNRIFAAKRYKSPLLPSASLFKSQKSDSSQQSNESS